jgi:uncharacterized repeat protein (TIGR01451 family)
MATIENFATVSYTSGGVAATKTSNIAEVELESSLLFSKMTLRNSYSADTPITYIITATNNSSAAISNITVTDDLATFTEEASEITPLTFIEDSALLLIDGIDSTAQLTVDTTDVGNVIFSFPSLSPNTTANIIYNAVPNEFAPLTAGSCLTNTATLTSTSECGGGTAEATVCVDEQADIQVIKSMSPNPVNCGDTITYTIRILNFGNIPAEDVVLTDTFNPAPQEIQVYRNGELLIGTGYTYIDGTLTVPATGGDTIPAATFTRDENTLSVITTPGVVEYVITGTI